MLLDPTMPVAELARRSREISASPAAVELQWGRSDYDEELRRWDEELDLCLIVPLPGWDHSGYRADLLGSLAATTLPERERALELGRRLAAELGVELSAPSLAEAGASGSRWIERQAPPREVDYEVCWEEVHWSDEGERLSGEGVLRAPGCSGKQACARVDGIIRARVGERARPGMTRAFLPHAGKGGWMGLAPPYPAGAPPIEAVRALKREGRSASALLHDLLALAPRLSTLSLMMVFEAAFEMTLETLGELRAHRAGQLADAALDAALEPRIEMGKGRWNRPFLLREARRLGASAAALLRADKARMEGSIPLIMSLREAFGVGLGPAKMLVDSLGHRPDAELDAELERAIAERR